jgi:hypothetical protein
MKRVGKKVKRVKGGTEGEAIRIVITQKDLIERATALITLVNTVKAITHSTATDTEKKQLEALRTTLVAAGKAISAIECPNPMYTIIAIDRSRLNELDGY